MQKLQFGLDQVEADSFEKKLEKGIFSRRSLDAEPAIPSFGVTREHSLIDLNSAEQSVETIPVKTRKAAKPKPYKVIGL